MIWATVSSWSCFCWMYREVLHLWLQRIESIWFQYWPSVMSMCRIFSCVVGRGCFLWPVCSLGKTLLAFSLLHSIFQGQICLLPQMFLYFLLLYSTPLWWKGHLFLGVSSKRSCRFKFSHGQLHVVSSCLPCGTNIASTFVFSASHLFPAIKKKKN